jgi:RNA polymerase sigma-70 factor (ECF subfamily)
MSDDNDERILIAQAAAGDAAAFRVLVARYENLVFSLCLRLVRCREDAADLAQEVFLHLYRKLPDYNEEGRFIAWLYRLALNRIRDHLKSRTRRDRLAECHPEFLDPVDARTPGPEGEAFAGQVRERLEQAAAKLPDRLRESFVLFYFSGLSLAETAAATSQSLPSTKVRLFRARRSLLAMPEVWRLKESIHEL